MRFVPVGREDQKLPDPVVLPIRQELVHDPVEGLSPESGGSCEALRPGAPYAEAKGRSQECFASPGNLPPHLFRNEGVGAEGKVRAVLDQGPHRKDQAGIPGQDASHLRPGEVLQVP